MLLQGTGSSAQAAIMAAEMQLKSQAPGRPPHAPQTTMLIVGPMSQPNYSSMPSPTSLLTKTTSSRFAPTYVSSPPMVRSSSTRTSGGPRRHVRIGSSNEATAATPTRTSLPRQGSDYLEGIRRSPTKDTDSLAWLGVLGDCIHEGRTSGGGSMSMRPGSPGAFSTSSYAKSVRSPSQQRLASQYAQRISARMQVA